jgi:hypothetical protein
VIDDYHLFVYFIQYGMVWYNIKFGVVGYGL